MYNFFSFLLLQFLQNPTFFFSLLDDEKSTHVIWGFHMQDETYQVINELQ